MRITTIVDLKCFMNIYISELIINMSISNFIYLKIHFVLLNKFSDSIDVLFSLIFICL